MRLPITFAITILFVLKLVFAELVLKEEELLTAIQNKDVKAVQAALDAGADVDYIVSSDKRPVLHHAVDMGDLDVVEVLLSKKPNLEAEEPRGLSAIHRAAILGDPLMIHLLVEHGSDIHKTAGEAKYQALHFAAEGGTDAHASTVESLLSDHLVDPDSETAAGLTAFHLAVEHENLPIVDVLLDHGANIDHVDQLGESALHKTARAGKNSTFLKTFLSFGPSVIIQNKDGVTPQQIAQHNPFLNSSLGIFEELHDVMSSINITAEDHEEDHDDHDDSIHDESHPDESHPFLHPSILQDEDELDDDEHDEL